MRRVQFAPISSAIAGTAAATVLGLAAGSWDRSWAPAVGWLVALSYLVVSNALLVRGLRSRNSTRFGPANRVTAVRSTLVGMISGIVVASFVAPVPTTLMMALVVPALVLDAVDGWVARHTNSTSELGARFDMEVDAFLLLVLSVYVSKNLGTWVLAIGTMRYLFVIAGWIFPWLRRQLPSRYWRKVVTAVQGIALATAATRLLPGLDALLVALALVLLLESFGRDVLWLAARRSEPVRFR
ncbi:MULTISPECIES: CDP-alcohol phosphatidyltransferase family protein [Cryobacterium]|uniref:CDP-alcohol phosphatidyltransferase family protein n=1 Tax=Cryobacterium glucosi TaxID=1259175 RepID=A0ABY2IQI0_9MICO|nr:MULTISPECIES: CDP-alcohol phosphatidyltransferase family protein [Cryobacterium]MDY7527859.1 CDP-alcohol phosphatidyltransferase family protein [Cryobacterium sp. 10C2]MDY7556374.1 CDP-alcohol phosphatidyltransferase family protein [Cryobacterium sp. 10C3]MEB0001419.1 CDP-alcohol phosphatidyltransferase family protein [Cryobacterium sp. RTC2.1]MEB0202211.1 CDP-alcohol phosphatidyltransferase family protein [Cryobacterium sp. 5I3]MEB0285954.1 CDP-alcohol phosphatidyltransferase family protei